MVHDVRTYGLTELRNYGSRNPVDVEIQRGCEFHRDQSTEPVEVYT